MTRAPIFEAALAAQAVVQKFGLPFCVIGGVALQRWGEPRYTADVDLSVLVVPGQEASIVQALVTELPPRVEDTEGFAARTRGVLLRTDEGADVTSILERRGERLDIEQIRKELRPLVEAKEQPELLEELERRLRRILPGESSRGGQGK